MPRYFFHLHNHLHAEDEEGRAYEDDGAAIDHAIVCIRDVASADVRNGRLDLKHYVVVVDEAGREIRRILFGEAIDVEK